MKKVKQITFQLHAQKEQEKAVYKDIRTTYQPIVNLSSGQTIGWEAFTRINNDNCFRFLYNADSVKGVSPFSSVMDKKCFENAIQKLGRINAQHKIFLNIQPQSFETTTFDAQNLEKFLNKYGIKPFQVVFEISSRNPFQNDVSFWNQLDRLQHQGIQFALDDVGSGQSDFRWIADLKPQYLKLDRQFYQNALSETIMKALLDSLVTFCNQMNICIIAERLENLSEIEYLVDMGIQYGQGYYLARPNFPKKPVVSSSLKNCIKPSTPAKKCQLMKCQLPIEKYLKQAPIINRVTTVENLKHIFDMETNATSVIVVDDGKPVGLVKDQHLYRILCRQNENAESDSIDLTEFMEQEFMVSENTIPAAKVVKIAAKKKMAMINSQIVVVSNEAPIGIVSFEELQDVFIRYQIDEARDANPLTGLPGNMAIQHALDEYYRIGHPISLIYVDLDHFKAFNDQYGFKKGDEILLQLSQILSWAVKRKGGQGDFLGHIGGDDFIIITTPEQAVGICQLVIKSFSRLRNSFYDKNEITQRFELGQDLEKERKGIPLAAVSLAIVDCRNREDITNLPERAASMKQYAKTIPGNAYVFDRRQNIY